MNGLAWNCPGSPHNRPKMLLSHPVQVEKTGIFSEPSGQVKVERTGIFSEPSRQVKVGKTGISGLPVHLGK